MLEKDPIEWTEQDIQEFITNGREEHIHLDYKSMDALAKIDGKKKEITKDISAFANSDGGVIIYGVKEYDDDEKKHLPERIEEGYDSAEISKEWLENVIISNIQPKINGLRINPVRLSNGKNIYAVVIPKSSTVHQASDQRYYRRYNFQSVPMNHYEIDDVRSRGVKTVLEPQFYKREFNRETFDFELRVHLINKGNTVAKDFMIEVSLPKSIIHIVSGELSQKEELQIIKFGGTDYSAIHTRISYVKPSTEIVVFPQHEHVLVPSSPQRRMIYRVDCKNSHEYMFGCLYWKLYADNSMPITGEIKLSQIQPYNEIG